MPDIFLFAFFILTPFGFRRASLEACHLIDFVGWSRLGKDLAQIKIQIQTGDLARIASSFAVLRSVPLFKVASSSSLRKKVNSMSWGLQAKEALLSSVFTGFWLIRNIAIHVVLIEQFGFSSWLVKREKRTLIAVLVTSFQPNDFQTPLTKMKANLMWLFVLILLSIALDSVQSKKKNKSNVIVINNSGEWSLFRRDFEREIIVRIHRIQPHFLFHSRNLFARCRLNPQNAF